MKKLTRRGFTAAGILAALSTGMTFLPGCNLIGCVYGPPPEDIEPDENEIVGVYGPPEYFGIEVEDEPDEEEYDPAENELVDVYGPPEYFDSIVEDGSGDNG